MIGAIKRIVKRCVFLNRVTAQIYYRLNYRDNISNDLVLSKIKQIAHRFDHRFIGKVPVANKDIYEIEYLIDIAIKRDIKFDDSIMWALGLYALAKTDAAQSYMLRDKINNDTCGNSALTEVVRNRRSVRKWIGDEVDNNLIKGIIETSIWAPSSCNRQPVRVIILNEGQKVFIRKYFPGMFWYYAPVQILILCNKSVYAENEGHFMYLDGGSFIQNMLLLFHEAGLGACWIGFKMWDIRKEISCEEDAYREFYDRLDIDEELVPLSLIVAGRYNYIPNAPARHNLRTIIIGGEEP